MYKHAALSPAIQALGQTPSSADEQALFEEQLGQMAFKTFAGKHPDLVENIVTFKMLDSDVEKGDGLGAFILSLGATSAYVPVVFADNELLPLDMVYLRDTDRFVPLSSAWIQAATAGTHEPLGEASKVPNEIPTDVDLRNLVVPPTTGRYSYAADAGLTESAGRSIAKLANAPFDPAMWQSFSDQYGQMNGVTPGVALDQGQADLDSLGKLYKAHVKTWGPEGMAAQQSAATQGQGGDPSMQQAPQQAPQGMGAPMQQGMAPQGMQQGMAPKFASASGDLFGAMGRPARRGFFGTLGDHADDIAGRALESGAVGAGIGAGSAIYDGDYSDLGGRMARGAGGAAVLGGMGGIMGAGLNSRHPQMGGYLDEIGHAAGTFAGGLGGALRPDPQATYNYGDLRMASVQDTNEGLRALVKHAAAPVTKRENRLPEYLAAAPNAVKTAFAAVLRSNPRVLEYAVETYGAERMLNGLRLLADKTAAERADTFNALRVTDNYTDTPTFGENSALAQQGMAVRGYFYEDKRKTRNRAVEVHEDAPQLTEQVRTGGVYRLATADGGEETVLVVPNPLWIDADDRKTFPRDSRAVKRIKRYAPGLITKTPEPEAHEHLLRYPDEDVTRSHDRDTVLAVTGSGKCYVLPRVPYGAVAREEDLKGTKLYTNLWTEKTPQIKAGWGVLVFQEASGGYKATMPFKVSSTSTRSDGVTVAKLENGQRLIIDPASSSARLYRPKEEPFVVASTAWRWMPVSQEAQSPFIITLAHHIHGHLLQKPTTKVARVHDAGCGQFSVNGKQAASFARSLEDLARDYDIPARDAEAMLKIAQHTGKSEALIIKTASPVDQALSEVLGGLGQQVAELQGQLQILQTVQQRAQELAGGGMAPQGMDPSMQQGMAPQGAPQGVDPSMQQAPQGMDPSMQQAPQGMGPSMQQAPQGMDPNSMQPPVDPSMDPSMQQMAPEPPPLPIMRTESPSAMEIQQQINPAFLDQAAQMQDQGVFDVGVINELNRAAGRVGAPPDTVFGDDYQDLQRSIDDLGRTLLMMGLRRSELQETLGDAAYAELEDRVRSSFQSLGELLLELQHSRAALSYAHHNEVT